ncbi:hypothetical protein [Terasakiella sp. SH-1]|uniref:hypothetical protein n=1 Tax=Terasakiella sp. SH-1 TaxID=2560057 RepID=UPI001073D424|nr:hypothetical protein [Terasakiella sp. SH-1]
MEPTGGGGWSFQNSSMAAGRAESSNRGQNDIGSRTSGVSMPFNYKTSGVTTELGKIAIFALVAFVATSWLSKGKKKK